MDSAGKKKALSQRDDLIAHGEESLALLNEGDRRIVRELIRTLRLRSA